MQLITMAHLGEAQGVIEHFQLKRRSPQLFENEHLSCLITGEGPFEAAIQTSAQLARGVFKRVLNLGIAGSLDEKYPIGSIHTVRSIYLVIEGKPQFKSFKSHQLGLDCLTSFERILHPEKAQKLQGLGTLIDREVWGVAMAAKSAGVPLLSYKLISDQAGSLGACEIVKSKAQGWSELLLQEVLKHLDAPESDVKTLELEGFYFTHSTSLRFEQYLKKLSWREELSPEETLQQLPLHVWREQKLLPKERTRLLLEHLEERLDPLKKILNQSLEKWKAPFIQHQIDLHTDPNWESPEVRIQFQVKSQEELEKKLKALSTLKIENYQKLRAGDLDVE